MPISDFRAADSMTKMRNMSRIPTVIENMLKSMKMDVTALPARSASFRNERFTGNTLKSARSLNSVEASRSISFSSSASSSSMITLTIERSASRLLSSSLSSSR